MLKHLWLSILMIFWYTLLVGQMWVLFHLLEQGWCVKAKKCDFHQSESLFSAITLGWQESIWMRPKYLQWLSGQSTTQWDTCSSFCVLTILTTRLSGFQHGSNQGEPEKANYHPFKEGRKSWCYARWSSVFLVAGWPEHASSLQHRKNLTCYLSSLWSSPSWTTRTLYWLVLHWR